MIKKLLYCDLRDKLTIPCFKHIVYNVIDKTNLWFRYGTRLSIEHGHNNGQSSSFLVVSLLEILFRYPSRPFDAKSKRPSGIRNVGAFDHHPLYQSDVLRVKNRRIVFQLLWIWLWSDSTIKTSSTPRTSPLSKLIDVLVQKTLTNLAKCSKCLVISVARIISITLCLASLYVSLSKFLKMFTRSSPRIWLFTIFVHNK